MMILVQLLSRRRLVVLALALLLSTADSPVGRPPACADEAPPAAAGDAPAGTAGPAANPELPSTTGETAEPTVPAVPELPPPSELVPYEVLVSVAHARDPQLDEGLRQSVLEAVGIRMRSRLGEMWNITVAEEETGAPFIHGALDRHSPDELNTRWLPSRFDKVFLAGLTRQGSRYTASVREWDRSSQTAGPAIAESTLDRRLAGQVLSELVMRAFRPTATVTSVREDTCELIVRAGEFLPSDPSDVPLRPGDYLTPYLRYLDRQRNVRQMQYLDWTYLRVESVDRARVVCRTISAFRAPLGGSRRRVELMAIRARPLLPDTELRLTPRNDPLNPMVGFRVDALDRMPTQEDPVADRLSLTTDRRGTVTLPADAAEPLRYILVHSGQSVLARVPFIPGLIDRVELNAPNDSARLEVEGALSLIEGELIDNLARRGVLMARARKAAASEKWDDVDQFIKEFNALPELPTVEQRIAAIETPAVQTARQLKDRVAEARIKRMCREIREIAAKNLDPDRIKEFRDEMVELRNVSGK